MSEAMSVIRCEVVVVRGVGYVALGWEVSWSLLVVMGGRHRIGTSCITTSVGDGGDGDGDEGVASRASQHGMEVGEQGGVVVVVVVVVAVGAERG